MSYDSEPRLTGWQVFISFAIALMFGDEAAHRYVLRIKGK